MRMCAPRRQLGPDRVEPRGITPVALNILHLGHGRVGPGIRVHCHSSGGGLLDRKSGLSGCERIRRSVSPALQARQPGGSAALRSVLPDPADACGSRRRLRCVRNGRRGRHGVYGPPRRPCLRRSARRRVTGWKSPAGRICVERQAARTRSAPVLPSALQEAKRERPVRSRERRCRVQSPRTERPAQTGRARVACKSMWSMALRATRKLMRASPTIRS